MFAIEEGLKKINGETVETFCREVVETNTELLVEAGTTGYKGGCCRDTGGRTFIGIVCECGDFHFGPVKNGDGQIIGVEIACCGDGGDHFAAHPGINKNGKFELFGDDSSYLCDQDPIATERAYRLARQARFEHGEKPHIRRNRYA